MSDYIITCYDELAIWLGNNVDSMKEIVRCKDCKHHHEGMCMLSDGLGDFKRWYVDVDDFCSDGGKG